MLESAATLASTNWPESGFSFEPAAIDWSPTATTEIRCPDRLTSSTVASAPARISSTASAASAGLRSRGAVGRRVGPMPRAPANGPAPTVAAAPGVVRSLLTAVCPAYASGRLVAEHGRRDRTRLRGGGGRFAVPLRADIV